MAKGKIKPELLKTIPYEYPGKKITIDISTDEFTCICPWSGLPDFAKIKISYIPRKKCVELKSLKLYIQSYRNVGIVHESVVNRILSDLFDLMSPVWILVEAEFNIRGGLKTVVRGERNSLSLKGRGVAVAATRPIRTGTPRSNSPATGGRSGASTPMEG
ncbi:MAG: preQ(1) synthase [Elusimicrobiota bacterium]